MRARRRVYIANTGGTIGMRRGPAGYAPAPRRGLSSSRYQSQSSFQK